MKQLLNEKASNPSTNRNHVNNSLFTTNDTNSVHLTCRLTLAGEIAPIRFAEVAWRMRAGRQRGLSHSWMLNSGLGIGSVTWPKGVGILG